MATALSEFMVPLRHILGDNGSPDTYRYEDSALLDGLQTIIKCGKLSDYTLTETGTSITPSVEDPNDFALLLYHTAKSFVAPLPSSYAYRTRAASETFGNYRDFISSLEQEIHELESGTMFDSWQSFGNWVQGVHGISLGAFLSPLGTVRTLSTISI